MKNKKDSLEFFRKQFKKMSEYMDSPFEKFKLISMLLFMFSIIYYVLYLIDKKNYIIDEKINNVSYFTFIWYSATTNFTVPLGDVYPATILAKTIMVLHIWMFWFIMLA